jgi:DNA topoisomerase-2
MSSNSELAQKYQRKTDKQHVLDNPGMYIGSTEQTDAHLWVFSSSLEKEVEGSKIISKKITYIPALYKLFDEIIVNARDHVVRMIHLDSPDKKLVTSIEVAIDQKTGAITVSNDGNGVDVVQHPVEKIWIPELIFANLRSSTNYDKTEKKVVGGSNGVGSKAVFIWSKYAKIETVDHHRGLKYEQTFHNNLEKIDAPIITNITKSKAKPYTCVTFIPDYARFGITGLTDDMMSLLKKRVYDIGAVTDHSAKKIKIDYNGVTVPVKNFQSYVDLYLGSKTETPRIYESASERWEYAVALSPTGEFANVSFVNGICTYKGGKHVDYIMGQVTRKLVEYIEKKKKVKVNANTIKEQLILFLRCDIENPTFDSQTKDCLNTLVSKFGSECTVSEAFVEKVAKMGVMDMACQLTETKEAGKSKKKMDGAKTKSVRGIPNLVDANFAGTEQSAKCILILAEGLSAMAGIVSGLKSEDRNVIGIYPLKGKVLNVRGATRDVLEKNRELTDLIKILGLEIGKNYSDLGEIQKKLRYGKIMIMTDQDLDGSHIKGLCINLFHSMWPSLYKIPGFISFMNTPILRATKGREVRVFYNEGEYKKWLSEFEEKGSSSGDKAAKGWTLKYFKGLGTSTATEFKEYFANKKIVDFSYGGSSSDDIVDMVFNKKRAEDRKGWLENYDKTTFLDTNQPRVSYENFFHQEMVHFSVYDNERSIPNLVDGLKTSLRKILFCAFKRRLTTEIKVAQFSGYVSENSAYHHGEASLNGAIVNMAQNFVGSNNVNLLVPSGQFGTRLKGGEDSASERYIFTYLEPVTRSLFLQDDDAILNYLNDDGTLVEPEYYVPILPFVLMNGSSGIGTGFSSSIPPYHPLDLLKYIRTKMAMSSPSTSSFDASNSAAHTLKPISSSDLGLESPTKPRNKNDSCIVDFVPYYEGFTGTVTKIAENKFGIKGKYESAGEDKIRITELPIGTWTLNYISFLEELVDGTTDKDGKKIPGVLKDIVNLSTEIKVDITVVFPKGKLAEYSPDALEKLLKLTTTVSTTNMHLFDADLKLHKYESVEEIIDAFYCVRLETYKKRKAQQIDALQLLLMELGNRAKFIQGMLDGTIDLRRKKNDEVDALLTSLGFRKMEDSFGYLRRMAADSVTEENVAKIMGEKAEMESKLKTLIATSFTKMWSNDLDVFEKKYLAYKGEREKIQIGSSSSNSSSSTKKTVSSNKNKK